MSVTFPLHTLRPGIYKIGMTYVSGFDRATAVPVTVYHDAGSSKFSVSQYVGYPAGASFFYLGQFDFLNTSAASILIENRDTGINTDNDQGSLVTVDAIVLQPVFYASVCTPVTECTFEYQYEYQLPTTTSDRVCKNCTRCNSTSEVYDYCTQTADTVCLRAFWEGGWSGGVVLFKFNSKDMPESVRTMFNLCVLMRRCRWVSWVTMMPAG
jgi:hypothetical protein